MQACRCVGPCAATPPRRSHRFGAAAPSPRSPALFSTRTCNLPPASLLRKVQGDGWYTDCFVTEFPGAIDQQTYVEAFYTTRLFKLERLILRRLVAKPSSDEDVAALAADRISSFAAWRVEDRSRDQLLLADFTGRTRSWLMATPDDGAEVRTRLYFGSAVVPRLHPATGKRSFGLAFRALLGFHRLYSRLLLAAARSRLLAGRR